MKKSFELGQKSKEPRGKRAFGASNTPSSAMNSKTVTFGRAATAGFSNFRSTKSVSPKRKTKFGKKVPLWVSNKKADVKVADLSEFLKNCSQHRDFTKEAMIAAFLRVNEMIYRLQEEEASFRVQIGQMKRENRSLSSEVALVEGDLEQINRNNLKDRSYYENQEVLLRKGLGIAPKSEACLQDTLKSISQSKAIDQKEKSVSLKKSLLKQPVTISKENEFLSKEIREIEKEIEGMSSFDYNRKKVNELYNQILNDQDDEESKSALLELVSRHRKVLESRSAQKAIQKEDLKERIEEMERLVRAKAEENIKKEKALQELEAQEAQIEKKLAHLQKSSKYKLTGVKAAAGAEYNFILSNQKTQKTKK